MLTIDEIKNTINDIVKKYPIKKVSLFGSYAEDTANADSDIDLLIEFFTPDISLFTLYSIQSEIQDRLHKKVDLIHAPVEKDSFITIGKVVELYEQ